MGDADRLEEAVLIEISVVDICPSLTSARRSDWSIWVLSNMLCLAMWVV